MVEEGRWCIILQFENWGNRYESQRQVRRKKRKHEPKGHRERFD